MTFKFQHSWLRPVVTWDTVITIDPCRGRTMDPDMVQVTVYTTQISIALVAVWPIDTNMAPHGGTDPWQQHGL